MLRSIEIIRIECCDDSKIITCRCHAAEYGQAYHEYPSTLRYLGDLFGKTGWNSDLSEVYYRV